MSDAKTEFESVSDCDGRVAELEHEHDSRIDGVSYSDSSTGLPHWSLAECTGAMLLRCSQCTYDNLLQ